MSSSSGNSSASITVRRQLISWALLTLLIVPPIIFFTTVAEATQTGSGSVSLTTLGTAYTQDFNTLASTGTSSTTPTGWYFDEGGTNANTTYTAGTGSGNAGDTYSFGASGNSERALGGLRSGSLVPTLGASFTNNTGTTISSLAITYTGEEWRLGTAGRTDRLDFQISTNATSLTTGTWVDQNSLDFTTPNTGAAVGALDGNAAANRTTMTSTISGLSIPNGAIFFIRWSDLDATGADDGLAIDDFSITPSSSGNPSVTGAADPSTVVAGASTLLTATVTPGTNPTSTGITATVDLTSIGGSASQTMFDDGTNGDVTGGDNVFSYQAVVAGNTSGGNKSLPVLVTDAQARNATTNISLTVQAPTNPSVVGAANPSTVAQGGTTLLTGTVTPGTVPTSTGIQVTGDLTSIGGSATQTFYDDGTHGDAVAGNNVFSFQATVSMATPVGPQNVPLTVTDAQARSGSGNIALTITQPPVAPGTIVISQIYGGGGNVDAPYTNDYIEIFNRSNSSVSLSGWSVQYASSAGTSWQVTALSGVIAPGHYYLIREAAGNSCSGSPCGSALPTPDAIGTINMAAASGKIAVVSSTTALSGACATGATVMDFVGYGAASCFEGAGAAPGLDNVTADLRTHLGCKDTDSNGGNFTAGAPAPRNSSTPANICPAGDFEPEIFATSPAANQSHVAIDSNITIDFDEPVNVSGSWFQISCGTSGLHSAVVTGGPVAFTLNPDTDFVNNEPCTVTIFASQVTDQDLDDPPDNMAANYVFTFNSEFARDPAEHMVMGNPSNAVSDPAVTTNFLMMKIQYALSYNNDRGTPNWTSWHLDQSWRGSAPRQDDFRNDPTLPPGFHQVGGGDYSGSGFDRGHMCPSADRTSTIPDNSATFLMTNMIPQAPGNNQGPWAAMENYLRTLLPGNELYILSGSTGVGGTGSGGFATTIAGGTVTVPAYTWKVALVLPVGDNDVSRVDANTRTIAVIMPNDDAIRPDQWQKYLATVDQVETLSGYDFYSNVPSVIQDAFESKLDVVNDTAPVTTDQTKTVNEDSNVSVTLTATDFNVNNVLTFSVVTPPQHGMISGSGANLTYTPSPNYFGPDSFSFKANDGALDSNVSNVNITVTELFDDAVLTPSGSTLSSESCPPFNTAVDPGERVTMNLKLSNTGDGSTSNLVATLLPTGGVIAPSGPQNYGVIAPSTSAGRDFSFTVNGTCGGTITVTLQLQDGATDLGTVTYNFPLGVNTGNGYVCTNPCGGPKLIVNSTWSRLDPNTVQVNATVQNIGTITADNVLLTTAKLGTTNGVIANPSLGSLAPGGTASTTINFANSTPGANATLTVNGSYSGGSFTSSKRGIIP